MQTSLNIKTNNVASDDDVTKAISYVNPACGASVCYEFGRLFSALGVNVLIGVERVDKTSLDAASKRRKATLTLSRTSVPVSELESARANGQDGVEISYTYDGDGTVEVVSEPLNKQTLFFPVVISSTKILLAVIPDLDSAAFNKNYKYVTQFQFKIRAKATDNYQKAEETITITA